MTSDARSRFGNRVRILRQERQMTQEVFAELIGRSVEHISFIERGERSPSFALILKLAEALDVSVPQLMNVDQPDEDANLITTLITSPVPPEQVEPVAEPIKKESERQSDLERLQAAFEGVRALQELAREYEITDIFQDNGGKVLQVLILLGLKSSPGREGNDAIDAEGNEYELKTLNRSLNKNAGVTTHHHLNRDILAKYRAVKAWYIAIYEGIELIEIYKVSPGILEEKFGEWERKLDNVDSINNPKLPMRLIRRGELVYQQDDREETQINLF